MSMTAESTINRNIILGRNPRPHLALWKVSTVLAGASALATAYFIAFPRHTPLRQEPPHPIVVKKIAPASRSPQAMVASHPLAPAPLPVVQVKPPAIKTVTASAPSPKAKQMESPPLKTAPKPMATAKPQTPGKPKTDTCSAGLAGKTSASMSGLAVRTILPDTLIYGGTDGATCTLRPGSALGTDERVTGVDAELLRVHTNKRTIQLIDK